MFAWFRKLFGMIEQPNSGETTGAPSKGGGASILLATIAGVNVRQEGNVIFWTGGMTVDADGSPRAYHPHTELGLDMLANAGKPGHWFGILTDNGRPDGNAVIQGELDPAPGFYVSTTALCNNLPEHCYNWNDPRRFVNAETVPYVVLPRSLRTASTGADALSLGDFALVRNLANGCSCAAICADIGPEDQIGEGSIALAKALGINADPRTGGCPGNILYCLFAGSRAKPAWPLSVSAINDRVAYLARNSDLNLPNLILS